MAKKDAQENPSQEAAETETAETMTVIEATTREAVADTATEIRHDKAATDKEDFAMKAAEVSALSCSMKLL